jgi:hypothetical protein
MANSGAAPSLAHHAAALGHAAVAPFHAAAADHALVARVLATTHVETSGSSPDASYGRDFLAWLADSVAEQWRSVTWRQPRAGLLWGGVVVLVAVAMGFLVLHRRAVRRAKGAEVPLGDRSISEAPLAAGVEQAHWDAATWRRELDRRLAQDRVPDALSAAWWWLARSLAAERVEPQWTGRDLLRWSQRDDLRLLVGQLDVLRYGPREPSSDDVRRLAVRLEAGLA